MTQDATSTATRGQQPVNRRWRTVDIIVAAVVAVAFGVVFVAWGVLYNAVTPVFVGFKPAQAVIYGMWLLPGVLGGLLIRKPGAAVFTELVAAVVSVLLGVDSPLAIILYGLVQGLARNSSSRRSATAGGGCRWRCSPARSPASSRP